MTRFATDCVHAGHQHDPVDGAVNPAVQFSTTFQQPHPAQPIGSDYTRGGNRTRDALEAALAVLDGGDHAFAFASGLAALDALLRSLRPGDHIVCAEDAYGGSIRLLNKIITPMGVEVTFVDTQDLEATEAACQANTKWVLMETPTNPLLRVSDIEAVAKIAHHAGAKLVVDSTFMSPALQKPLALGADVVFHSATKYLGGHSDVLAGVIVTSDPQVAEDVKFQQMAAGAVLGPMDCYLLLRGMRTLDLRVRHQSRTAMDLAIRLAERLGHENVLYPGLPSHPNHEVQIRQAEAGGGMLSFRVPTGPQAVDLVKTTKIFQLAESLGAVESLIQIPALMTHASVPPEMREATGLTDGLIRVSVGIEDVADLWEDLDQALQQVGL